MLDGLDTVGGLVWGLAVPADLDQFVGSQLIRDLGDECWCESLVADLYDGFERVSQGLEKLLLFAGEGHGLAVSALFRCIPGSAVLGSRRWLVTEPRCSASVLNKRVVLLGSQREID